MGGMNKTESYYIFLVLQFIIVERIFIKLLQKIDTFFCIHLSLYIYYDIFSLYMIKLIDKKVKLLRY